MSTVVSLATRDCTTPGCDGEGARNVAGLPFCQACLNAEPHKVLRAMAQRAEMTRQAEIADERAGRRRADDLQLRRRQKERRQRQHLDARTQAVLTLQRLIDRAARVGDTRLEHGLRAAADALAAELVKPGRVA